MTLTQLLWFLSLKFLFLGANETPQNSTTSSNSTASGNSTEVQAPVEDSPYRNFARSDLIYQSPVYPINVPAITVGGIFDFTFPNGSININGYENFLAVVGNFENYNNGKGLYEMVTKFFIDAVNGKTNSVDAVAAAMTLLSQNLINSTSNVTSYDPTAGLGGIFGGGNYISLIDTASVFEGTGLPFLDYGDSLDASIGTASYVPQLDRYRSLYRLSPSSFQSLSRAVVDTLVYFNWTLVTPIFLNDYFGFDGQAGLLPELERRGILTQCGAFLYDYEFGKNNSKLETVSSCLSRSDSKVVILWMGALQASQVAGRIYDLSGEKNLVFFLPERRANEGGGSSGPLSANALKIFESSIFFTPLPRPPVKDIPSAAFLESLKPGSTQLPLFNQYWEAKFQCRVEITETVDETVNAAAANISSLEANSTEIINSTSTSTTVPSIPVSVQISEHVPPSNPDLPVCTGEENLLDTSFSNQYVYAADAVNAYVAGVYYIQKNCTYLTEASEERNKLFALDYCNLTYFVPAILSQAIGFVEFEGDSGYVNFGNNSNVKQVPTLVLQQLNATGNAIIIGKYDGTLTVDNSSLAFRGGKVPVSAVVPDDPNITYAVVAVFWGIIIALLVISFSLSIFFFVYRNNPVIKKSSPSFCQLILVGVDCVLLSVFIFSFETNTAVCFLFTWLLVLGSGLIIANLLAKNYRIYRIFGNEEAAAVVITDNDLLIFSAVVLLGELILLSVYSFVSGYLRPYVEQSQTDIYYKYIECLVPSQAIQLTFQLIIYFYNGILVLIAAYLAFATRNVDSAYNESRYIAFTIYSYLVVCIILLPLYYTAGDSDGSNTIRYVLLAVSVILAMSLTLGALFGSKVLLVLKEEKRKKKRASGERGTTTMNTSGGYAPVSNGESNSNNDTTVVQTETGMEPSSSINRRPSVRSETLDLDEFLTS